MIEGRFGNQAEQFLGTLSFTHTLNRTLVLPHWVEYPPRSLSSVNICLVRLTKLFRCLQEQIPYDRYFQVEPLRDYLKVISMKDFMAHLADQVWPKGKRYGRTSSSD